MTSLTKTLVVEGILQDMESEEELLHNALAVTSNAVVSIALKIEDSILCVLMAPVI